LTSFELRWPLTGRPSAPHVSPCRRLSPSIKLPTLCVLLLHGRVPASRPYNALFPLYPALFSPIIQLLFLSQVFPLKQAAPSSSHERLLELRLLAVSLFCFPGPELTTWRVTYFFSTASRHVQPHSRFPIRSHGTFFFLAHLRPRRFLTFDAATVQRFSTLFLSAVIPPPLGLVLRFSSISFYSSVYSRV